MNLAARTAKRAFLGAAKAGGLFKKFTASNWRNQRLLILCYHGISLDDEHLWNPKLYMDVATFRSRMQLLRDRECCVLPLDEALMRLQNGTLPPRSVVLTFDDGSYDLYALGCPLLREFQYPATIYLTTYYCRRQLPVFDTVCSYLLWKGRKKTLSLDGLLPEGGQVSLAGDAEWRGVSRRLWRYVRETNLSAQAKDALAEKLADALGIDYADLKRRRLLYIMTASEAAEVARQGVSLELHTHRHVTPGNRDAFLREIRENASEITDIAGTVPRHFCYPIGDYLPEFFGWLRECGVRSATTCDPGLVSIESEPMQLPRLLDDANITEVEMESWLSGFAPRLREQLGRSSKVDNPYAQVDPRRFG
jgi:peptidoglycan/xylan/chitin deacetylase (PgdA/CDA1 family)